MAEGTLHTEISIQDTRHEEVTRGTLTISSTETIHIDEIEGYVISERRGKSSKSDMLLPFIVTTEKVLIKDEVYKIPFLFKLRNSTFDSYEGKIIQISYKCQINILVKKEDISKLKSSLFTKGRLFWNNKNSIKASKFFKVESATNRYQIVETKANFSFKLDWPIFVFAIIVNIAQAAYFWFSAERSILYMMAGVIISLVVAYLILKGIERVVGIIFMETLIDDKAFRCNIKKPRKLNVSNAVIYYEIIERVNVGSGEDSRTYKEVVHTSEKQQLSNLRENKNLKFYYPKDKTLHSMKHGAISRLWKMRLEGVRYFGFPLKYECDIKVERV